MVAVYDDIDYAKRSSLAGQLEVMASSATGFPVSVYVTDRPEWRMRTIQVHTSLEARIAERGIVLVEREAGKVNWNKEMVMPQSDYEQGLYRLGRVNEGLVKLANALEPGKMEHLFAGLDDTEGAELAEIGRMLTLGGTSHTVTEQSVKALVHLTEKRSHDLKGHHIKYLIERLGSEPMKSQVESLLALPVRKRSPLGTGGSATTDQAPIRTPPPRSSYQSSKRHVGLRPIPLPASARTPPPDPSRRPLL